MDKLTMTPSQRLITAAAGAAFMVAGSRRRSIGDAALGLGGFSLLYWAFASPPRAGTPPEPEKDVVDIASEESFPASDPPGW